MLVTADGRVLGPAPARGGLARVRLSGPAPPEGARITEADARLSLQLVRALPAALSGRLRELRVEGGQLLGSLAGGPQLRLGPPDDIAVKAQALTVVLDHLTPDEERTATYLDVSVPERPALGTAPRPGAPPPPPSA